MATFLNGQVLTAEMLNNAFKTKLDMESGNQLDARLTTTENLLAPVEEHGLIATIIEDESGMTQQQVNDKTAIFYNTVAEMVADTKLKAGKAVITHGYYSANDGGGARYLIQDTATDYSIPVANNLHAVFADSFDIRKFGIRNNATLDQTAEIKRMVNYADTRVYEIDFLNFSLMTPKIVQFSTSRTTLVGMGFRKVHHLKNLIIANNKTEQLIAGTNPILFLPDDLNGRGKFKLSNIKFDPYVSNFALTNNGEADGYMCGFAVEWHKDSNWVYPNSNWVVSNYDIELDDIEFLSPAISYNLACAGIFTRNLTANNIRGDYWGLMLVHHTYNLDANNVQGVFRDDLHTPSGRLLVTNLIHEEAEIANEGIITRNNINVKNSSCFKKTDGSEHCVYKCHRIGTITINNVEFDNIKGSFEFYAGATDAERQRLTINKIKAGNMGHLTCKITCVATDVSIADIDVMEANIIDYALIGKLTIDNIQSLKSALSVDVGKCDTLQMNNIKSVSDEVYGIVRSDAQIRKIELSNITCNRAKLIDCKFETLTINNLTTNRLDALNQFINSRDNTVFLPPTITLNKSTVNAPSMPYVNLVYAANDGAKTYFNDVTLSDGNHGMYPTPIINNCRITVIKAYDPPSLATATQQSMQVTLQGAKVGDVVMCSFSESLQGTRIWAEVTAANTVTVYHRNDTGGAIDLPNGALTIKLL